MGKICTKQFLVYVYITYYTCENDYICAYTMYLYKHWKKKSDI